MLRIVALATLLGMAAPVAAQDAVPSGGPLIDGLNNAVNADVKKMIQWESLPQWGVLLKDQQGNVVDTFGQVTYETLATGDILVPGYTVPEGYVLEVAPTDEYLKARQETTPQDVDLTFQPVTVIPRVVMKATDYLAEQLCGKKGRPSAITLSIVANMEGGVPFFTVGGETGSEVTWDFADICPIYGLEGENIAFK